MQSNPVVSAQGIAAAVSAVIMAFLAMLVSIGVISLDTAQMNSVQTFLTAAGALAVIVVPQLVAAFWAKRQVVTKTEVAQMVQAAAQERDHA